MRKPAVVMLFILSLLAFVIALSITAFALVVGGKFRTVQEDFEGPIGIAIVDSLADLSVWLTGRAGPGQSIPGAVWLIGIPLTGLVLSAFLWRRSESGGPDRA